MTSIPSYELYGEVAPDAASVTRAGYTHIETIAERSALTAWEIAPHRHADFIQLLLVMEGRVEASFDGTGGALDGPGVVMVASGVVHGFRFAPDTSGYVLTLSGDFSGRALAPDDPLPRFLTASTAAPLAAAEAASARRIADEMLALQQAWRPGDALSLALAEALVHTVLRGLAAEQGGALDDRRFARFRQLVERHYRDHHPAEFYAGELGITLRTLSRMTAERAQCSPMGFVHRRLAMEAVRLLHYTNASAAQVCTELGFVDPSYFSRFCLRMTGRRPMDHRREHRRAGA
ncbi:helix-turn-helix domain-containing protein [Novosphingobium lentum]|uniref:helix-turn-helix domain-containing protein n=1 Tax=Novosphingobium lentum TaxID=145287 RepID=UPI00083739EF|nr:helix-turn-helix domain-containing protein [Novosphingobium lentum]